jgi:hypothetical protein
MPKKIYIDRANLLELAFGRDEVLLLFERLGRRLTLWLPLKGLLGGTFLVILTLLFSTCYLGLGLDMMPCSIPLLRKERGPAMQFVFS